MKKRLLIIISTALLIASVLSTGCFEKKESDKTVVVTGNLGDGFIASKNISKAVGVTSVSEVIAIPLDFNFLIGRNYMADSVISAIKADNSFLLDLDKVNHPNWIFLLVDPNKDKREKVSGYISISDVNANSKIGLGGLGSIESIVNVPVSSAAGSIDVGSVNQDGDEAGSSNGVDFDLSLDRLNQLAKTDNAFKIIKNTYINYNGQSNSLWNFLFYFSWDIASTGSLLSTKNNFSPVNQTDYLGYTFTLGLPETNPFFTYSEVANQNVTLALYPPSDVSSGGLTWGASRPFANDGYPSAWASNIVGYSDSDFGVTPKVNDVGEITIGLSARRLEGNIPAGYWSLRRNGIEISIFDFKMAEPFYNNDFTKPNVFIPSIKATVDSSNIITKIEVIWYLYDKSTDSFKVVTDLSALKYYQLGISGSGFNDYYMGDAELSKLKRTMYFSDGIGTPKITNMSMFYGIVDGIIYWYNWN